MITSLIVALIVLVCICGLIYYAPFIPAPIKQFAYFIVFCLVVLWVLKGSGKF
jgi:hypothetical protein